MSSQNDTQSFWFILRSSWWLETFALVKPHARFFAVPSGALAAGNIIAVVADVFFVSRLASASFEGPDVSSALIGVMAGLILLLIALLVSLLVSLWGLSVLLVRLTALAHCCMQQNQIDSQALEAATKKMKDEQRHYTLVWIFGSLILLLPALPLAVMIALLISARIVAFGQPLLVLPEWMPLVFIPAIALLSLVTVVYALVLLAVSADLSDKLSPWGVAVKALRACWQKLLPVCLVGMVVSLANVVITAPQLFLSGTSTGDWIRANVWVGTALQIWFGVAVIYLWPISVLAFVELFKPPSEVSAGA